MTTFWLGAKYCNIVILHRESLLLHWECGLLARFERCLHVDSFIVLWLNYIVYNDSDNNLDIDNNENWKKVYMYNVHCHGKNYMKPALDRDFTTYADLFTEMHFYWGEKRQNDELIILFSYFLIVICISFYTRSVVFWHVIFWE